jgi:Protein of unknown function (DUF2852)
MSSSPNWNTQGAPWQRPEPGGQGTHQGAPNWGRDPPWHERWDSTRWDPSRFGRTPMIVATVLGFVLWWPVGLVMLGYLWWSGQMGCWGRRATAEGPMGQGFPGRTPMNAWAMWRDRYTGRTSAPPSSGNRAFDEYRQETLRRLEELRVAKDKAEFDQFMAERWQRPTTTPPEQPPQP